MPEFGSSCSATSQNHQIVFDAASPTFNMDDHHHNDDDMEDGVKGRSKKAKKNRLSELDGPGMGYEGHRRGSRSAVVYSYDPAREQGIPMGQIVVPTFQKLHYNQAEGAYTSGKAKRIAEEYEARIVDMSQGLPEGVEPTPTDHAGIFIGIAQDPAKHHIFELDSLYQPEPVGYSCASFPSVTSTFERTSQPQIEEMQAELRAEREARLRVEGELASLSQKFTSFQEQCRQQHALINRLLNERDTPENRRS